MLLVARNEGLPLLRAWMYLCTPALDLSVVGYPIVSNAHDRDIMSVSFLTNMVPQNYRPKVVETMGQPHSPMYAEDDESFPPIIMAVGTRDFALSNGVRFHWKLRGACVKAELLVSERMWHGFNCDPVIPEALRSRRAVIEFLGQCIIYILVR